MGLRTQEGPVEDMGINHCGLDIGMAQKFLNRPNIVSTLKQVRGKGMAEGVASGAFGQSC